MRVEHDLVIRGGTVVDGNGGPATVGDVAISDGWITHVGAVAGRGAEEIEATGLLVTPGFVDVHTHYDGQLIWSDRVIPSSNHGVTTVVTGNCGLGFAPCRPSDRRALIELMEGVEDIPGAVTEAGLTWDWESFPEYLDALERRTRDIDVGVLIPHSPVRVYAMGERALRRESASPEDRAQMRALVRGGLAAGALGFGTSQLSLHKSSRGELIPTFDATEIELREIAEELRAAEAGVFQIVTNVVGPVPFEEQLAMIERLAGVARRPVTFTNHPGGNWRSNLRLLDEANARPGIEIKVQLLPRPSGMMLGLSASAHPFCMTPTYLALKDRPLTERVAAMREPRIRAAMLGEQSLDPSNPLMSFVRHYERMFPMDDTVDYEPPLSRSISETAQAQGRSSDEVVYDALLAEDGNALLMVALANYDDGNLDWMEEMFDSPNVVLGLGDGGAHYGMICDASFTTFALSHWTRDRPQGRRTIEDMVRRLTREPALLVGLEDRGLVAPGYRASLNVIDYTELRVAKPRVIADLPAGGRRLHQDAQGYVATIVNGRVIARNGEPTSERPGRLVRGAQRSARKLIPA